MEEETHAFGGSPAPPRPGILRRLLAGMQRARRAHGLPSSIGRYRIVRQVGEGGMGTVFEAEDEVLGRRVAIKRLKAVDESARRRFWREARAVARLNHPNVCQLYEVGEDVSGPFLAMELLTGEPLSSRLRRGPMSGPDVVALGSGMLAALSAIHAAGLVHRDLKPSNVYLTPFGPRLLDFGLVRPLPAGAELPSELATPASPADSGGPITDSRLLVGTPRYMAPEQILGGAVDARTDLFATAAVLYEALSGRPAFGGTKVVEVLRATLQQAPEPLAAPLARLDAVLRRGLAKDPDHRFASAQEMAEALHAAAAAPPPAAPRAGSDHDGGEVFVGRAAELAWLEQRLEAARAGAGGVVFVTGERGAGKSALANEMLRRARASGVPMTIVAGRCLEHQGPREALQPFLDAMSRLFGTSEGREHGVDLVRTFAPTVSVLLPPALVPDPDGALHRQTAGATRERMIREGGDFMDAAARIYPVLLLLEDLQWADPLSVDVLGHLGRRAARQRILYLCTSRPSEVEAANVPLHRVMLELRTGGQGHELALGPLAAADVEQWLDRRFPGNDFAAGLAPLLYARAEGLPLFVRGLLELLAGRRDIEPHATGYRMARPLAELDLEPSKDLKDLVRAHLATLPAPERELLSVASVLGKEFSSAIARALAGGDELGLEERLQRLCRVDRVLVSGGEEELPDGAVGTRYRFAHGLYQRVLYEDLVAPRRAELHRRAGELLVRHCGENAPTSAVEMAEHFERGRAFARAVQFRTLAGEHAARRFAGAEAVEQYTAALSLVEKLPSNEAQPLVTALYGRRASARQLQARFDESVRDYERMVDKAREARLPGAECEALSRLCTALFFNQRLPEMAARANEALAAARRTPSPHHLAEARARAALVLVVQGRLEEAGGELDRVITDARKGGSAGALQIGLTQRGFVHYWRCEYGAAEERLSEALVLCEERGDGFEATLTRMMAGLSRANLGRMSEALVDFEHAILLARRNGEPFWEPRLLSQVGWLHRELAAIQRARGYDNEALAIARDSPVAWSPRAEVLLSLCLDRARGGDGRGAAEHLAVLEPLLVKSDWLRWMNELRLEAAAAEIALLRGAFAVALDRAARLATIAGRVAAPNYSAAAARFAGEAALAGHGEAEEAAARLERALGVLERFPTPLEGWKSRRVLGLLRRRAGDAAGAQAMFGGAADEIATIARGVDNAALREGFLSSPAVREVLVAAGRA